MSLNLQDLIFRFETWALKRLAVGTVLGYRRHLDRFAAAVGNVPVETLKAHHLLEWGETWHQIQAVQRLFNWATNDAELMERSPFNRVKRPRIGKRKRIFGRAELRAFMHAARSDFRFYLFGLRETIARPQEIRALAWEEIRSLDAKLTWEESLRTGQSYFLVEEYKARLMRIDPDEPRIIPISATLGRCLVRLARVLKSTAGLIFRTYRGQPWTKEAVRLRMKRLRRKLGSVPDRRGENLVAYSVRHTMATAAVARGVRDRVLADLMGHTSTRTTARYQHLTPSHLVEAMGTLAPKPR